MISGTLTARHRHEGQYHEAGERLTLDADTAALLVSIGKFSPDKDGGGAIPSVQGPGAMLPQIPQKKSEASDFSPKTEATE